jgi:hypothetical protein
LDDVAGVLLLEPVFPSRPPDEREEILTIELVEEIGIGQEGVAGDFPGHDVFPLSFHSSRFVAESEYLLSREEGMVGRNGPEDEKSSLTALEVRPKLLKRLGIGLPTLDRFPKKSRRSERFGNHLNLVDGGQCG